MKKLLPKSTEKTLLAFEDFIRKDQVAAFVREYRKQLGIPENGLDFTEEDKDIMNHKIDNILHLAFGYMPSRIFPLPEDVREEYEGKGFRIINTLRAVVGSQGYRSNRMCSLFVTYFFFNMIYEPVLHVKEGEDDLVSIFNLAERINEYDREDMFMLQFFYDEMVSTSKEYPIAICVNPEITLNELKDFLSANWHLISGSNKNDSLYKGKRKKPKREIYDFIYSHKDLPLSEIMSLALERGIDMDQAEIGKILSIERGRRS